MTQATENLLLDPYTSLLPNLAIIEHLVQTPTMNQVVVVVNTVRIIISRNDPLMVQGGMVALRLLHKWNNILEQLPNWNACLLRLLKY